MLELNIFRHAYEINKDRFLKRTAETAQPFRSSAFSVLLFRPNRLNYRENEIKSIELIKKKEKSFHFLFWCFFLGASVLFVCFYFSLSLATNKHKRIHLLKTTYFPTQKGHMGLLILWLYGRISALRLFSQLKRNCPTQYFWKFAQTFGLCDVPVCICKFLVFFSYPVMIQK